MKTVIAASLLLLTAALCFSPKSLNAQPNEDELGAWYMYFWKTQFKDSPIGLQGDVQFRNWNLGGDLEQLLLRGGFTYSPKESKALFTLGYGNITTGAYGDATTTTGEHRIYQEALLPQGLGSRVKLTHRYRFEQRFVDGQDFRTRMRYNLFVNVLLNSTAMEKSTIYLSLYNELFANMQRSTGVGTVEVFDRNRAYAALGYGIANNLRVQLGYMQQTTNSWNKGQVQLSLHHKF